MKRIRTAILSISLLTIMATDTVAPLVKQIGASFPDVNPTLIKQTITLPSLLMIFFGLLAGQLVKIISKKTVLLIGLVFYSIGGLAAGWTNTFTGHLLYRCLLGAGTGLISPLITSLIADYYHGKERADMVGYTFALSHLVAVVTPPLAAWVGANNWRNAFYIFAIAPLVLLVVAALLPKKSEMLGEETKEIRKAPIPGKVFLLSLIALGMVTVFFIIITDLPYFFETKQNIAPLVAAFGLSFSTFGSTIAGLAFSTIYVRIRKWLIPIGIWSVALGFILITFAKSSSLILFGLFLTGIGIGLLIALINLAVTDAVEEGDSTAAVSVVNTAYSIAIFISPFFYTGVQALFSVNYAVENNFILASLLFSLAGLVSIAAIPFRRNVIRKAHAHH